MAQPAPPTPTPAQLQSQISSLHSLLTTLTQTRTSLPSLLRSFSHSPSTTPTDRASIYRTASHSGEELEGLESVLAGAEESERRDSKGIRIKQREVQAEGGKDVWEKLQEVLGGGSKVQDKGKGKGREYHSSMGEVTSVQELRTLVGRWEVESNGRVKVEVLGGEGREPHQLVLLLKGVMRCVLSLEWEGDEGMSRCCMVERVACFGLKEEKAPYLPSQYSLFNGVTAAAMEVVEKGLMRRERQAEKGEKEEGSNLEELLAFLSDPPLPF
ncbi:hypothetical protein BCR35DRAFT_305293 [Leucosporidium creatinivorum]|uniref:Uncharacterized protein n=1 Tax=Leucosporidium creatinivorum TaxID=106004 RepID=A0A1Y2F0X8_9BASI|nr:hypothetical protein BCR35DRAFT_305293 [Leucosporidium creatinivorum]